jgi:hypothetical protein
MWVVYCYSPYQKEIWTAKKSKTVPQWKCELNYNIISNHKYPTDQSPEDGSTAKS